MNLNQLLKQGVNTIMKTAGRYYLGNKKGRAFLAETLPHIKKSASLREQHEAAGTHIPVFLIASVASQCNLSCKGCYARTNNACGDISSSEDLSATEWDGVFAEAGELGVSFVLIAGGEPFMRPDVIKTAAAHKKMVFPIFTNGTMFDDEYIALFEANRNLIPVLSLEGGADETDLRRGEGTFERVELAMKKLASNSMLYGVSITVTSENIDTVFRQTFMDELCQKGCGVVIYVEYVPTEPHTEYLALNETDLARVETETEHIRQQFKDVVILAFPGDEELMGGCLASGRGFFNINPTGGAEPCPFSPYSKLNVRSASLKTVLESEYFKGLREIAANAGPHTGGCTLFTHEDKVKALLAQTEKREGALVS